MGSGTYTVGPGIWGFIAFFVLAVALWFLVRNMNSRLRRMAYRDRDETDQVHTDDADGARVTGSGEAEGRAPGDGARSAHADDRRADEGPDGAAPRP